VSALLVLIGIALCIVSGFPAIVMRRTPWIAAPLIIAGAIAGLAGCALGLVEPAREIVFPWLIPGGAFHMRVDALSAFFAAPVFLLAAVGGLADVDSGGGPPVKAFFGVMTGSLVLMMTAVNAILFIAAWEIVAAAAFFLVVTEHEKPDVRRAGWIYLAASHVATLGLFAIVALLHGMTHSWSFVPLPLGAAAMPAGRAVFWLAIVAFGIKAGLMPFHVWLPGAHAAAPSHVSAVLSGVVIKMGIYGLVRVLSLFDVIPDSFGVTILFAGIVSSIFGVAFALAQHDLKRLLAYHSIENIGIIVTGIGIGVLAQSHGLTALAMLGYAGALLHVWNHSLFKALLFLSGGAAVHAVHTREIDRMGGLGRAMPWTAAAFLTGAVAISGLPPLNGFVSEWLLYVAGFSTMTTPSAAGTPLLMILAVPALALTGALALACFVKAFGAVFLGAPRTAEAASAHESPRTLRIAMLPLALACIAIGLFPATIAPLLGRAIRIAAPQIARTGSLVTYLQPVQTAAITFAAIAVLISIVLIAATRRARRTVTWDCGYLDPTARMQYTSSSFARGLVAFFAWAMPAEVHGPQAMPLFPPEGKFESHVPDTVFDRALMPALRGGQRLLGYARYIQSGHVQLYLLYVVVTLVILLAWSAA
jgi:hydrogenase-4 component B